MLAARGLYRVCEPMMSGSRDRQFLEVMVYLLPRANAALNFLLAAIRGLGARRLSFLPHFHDNNQAAHQ